MSIRLGTRSCSEGYKNDDLQPVRHVEISDHWVPCIIANMKSSQTSFLAAFTWAVSASASLASTVDSLSRSTCLHSATDRGCWDGVHDIDTNWYVPSSPFPSISSVDILILSRYDEIFYTGVVREYWLEVTNTTLAPDGVEREAVLSFNNSLPGPQITADWGDEIIVHVTNRLQSNGTSIHWHGIRQLNTSEFDGVPGVVSADLLRAPVLHAGDLTCSWQTQCPIAPGGEMTYRFHASQYGTTVCLYRDQYA